MTAALKLSLSVQYAVDISNLPTRSQFRRWIQCALQRDVKIALRIVGLAEGRALNKNYRAKDYATNVLTFAYHDTYPWSSDIVMCAPVVAKEAREQHKTLAAHYAHLVIHAVLHLQGYDHENDADAAVMEALETALLAKLRYADPYRYSVTPLKGVSKNSKF